MNNTQRVVYQQAVIKERKELGLCVVCGDKYQNKTFRCDKCLAKGRDVYYQRKKLGLCTLCNKPKDGSTVICQECRNKYPYSSTKCSERSLAYKLAAFDAYGGRSCNCCKEYRIAFLSLDHINNDGAKHRKEVGQSNIYTWLKKNNYPSGFQVLCHNCNQGKYINGGICPHAQECTAVQ